MGTNIDNHTKEIVKYFFRLKPSSNVFCFIFKLQTGGERGMLQFRMVQIEDMSLASC